MLKTVYSFLQTSDDNLVAYKEQTNTHQMNFKIK